MYVFIDQHFRYWNNKLLVNTCVDPQVRLNLDLSLFILHKKIFLFVTQVKPLKSPKTNRKKSDSKKVITEAYCFYMLLIDLQGEYSERGGYIACF